MIKVTGKSAVRSTTATYIEPETREKHQISVEYYSHTTAALKARMAEAEREDEEYQKRVEEHEKKTAEAVKKNKPLPDPLPRRLIFPKVRGLMMVLHALPDLTDAKGKPFTITSDNLDLLSDENLDNIEKAIRNDVEAKKSQPAD
jgi:hypothetical protein